MKLSVLFMFLVFLSCNKKTTERSATAEVKKPAIPIAELPKLYVNYFRDTLYQDMSEKDADSIVAMNAEYFEIPLIRSMKNGRVIGDYMAMDDSSQLLSEKRSVRFLTMVIDTAYGGPASFAAPSDFLTYMSERGYEKIAETKIKEGIYYSFKRKSKEILP